MATHENEGARADKLVPDTVVCEEFGVTLMTLWRWDQDKNLGFPPKIKIRGRNYRSRDALDTFKQRLVMASLSTPAKRAKPSA